MLKGTTKRFARAMGFTLTVALAAPALADPAADDSDPGEEKAAANEDKSRGRGKGRDETPAQRAERLEKRRQRLLKGAERLRERAAELRKRAAAGEKPTPSSNSKRPPRSLEDQAKRFEEQANKMENRAKNLDAEDAARANKPERSPASIRERRHKIRKAQLNRRWGATLRSPDAIAELRTHAERVAKLKRIRQLAQGKSKDDPNAKRASELLAKEDARHERRMKEIQGKVPDKAKVQPASAEEGEK